MKNNGSSAPTEVFGLIAWLEETRIALPLKGVECRFDVTGAVACVEVDQIYHQNANRPLDCAYAFPLPAGAAVYRCEVHLNGRVIRAKVEERGNARRTFRRQKAAGRRTALVEMERENVFTLSLGNVQPGDLIVVRFAWFQVLDRVADGLRLMVPACPGVRYIPGRPLLRGASGRGSADDTDQVPDASRITPPRIDALHPDAAYFSIEGRLSAGGVESGSASSPTHPIHVREAGTAVTVRLSGQDAVPDRDFVLAWREPRARQLAPQSWRWRAGGHTYALIQLRAPENVQVAEGCAQDFYFLVDRSGSMEGRKWERTCEALHAFVRLLGAEDRVWITLFESEYRDFAEVPMPAPAVLADAGFQRIESLGVGGGTELLPAALHVLARIATHSADRRASVVLITDGQVGNEQQVVRAFQETAAHVRVHTFGIDTAVNDAFLKVLARQQRGGCWLQTPDDDIVGTIAALAHRLRRPVLTDLKACGAWAPGRDTLPDLHAGEVVAVALRDREGAALEIVGRLADGREHRFALDPGATGSEAIKLLWAGERIAALMAANQSREAIALAKEHNLICEGAAFIAWDEAEQVQIATEIICQPAMDPAFSEASPRCGTLAESRVPASRYADEARLAEGKALLERHRREVEEKLERLHHAIGELLREIARKIPELGACLSGAAVRADEETLDQLHVIRVLAGRLSAFRNRPETWPVWDLFRQSFTDGRPASPAELIGLLDRAEQNFELIQQTCAAFARQGAPTHVIEKLVAWGASAAFFRSDRLLELLQFAKSLANLPASAGIWESHWGAFLHANVEPGSELHDAVTEWFRLAATTRTTKPRTRGPAGSGRKTGPCTAKSPTAGHT